MRKSAILWLSAVSIWLSVSPAPVLAAGEIHIATPSRTAQITLDPLTNPQQVVLSVLGPSGEPIRGLRTQDFVMGQGIRKARIISVEPLQASKAVPINLVLVIDNSFSMQERHAIQPLLSALEGLLKDVRPIDNIHAVVFSDRETRPVGGRAFNVKTFKSGRASEWKAFFADAFDRGITQKTYLYEAVAAGLDIVKRMPANEQKLMAVFSDGEDLNSKIGKAQVELDAYGINKFQAYAIDYMPREQLDEFLASFARNYHGRIWKARSAAELGPIFQDFKSTILHKYVLTYELANPIALEPKILNFEQLTTTTGSPASGMVFFHTGKSEIPDKYILYKASSQAETFQPSALTGSLGRYFNILNFVGKALREAPEARVGIVGCTSEIGVEKNNLALAQSRAEAVKNYLLRIWGVDSARMLVEARGLPAAPSTAETRNGRHENQRVEFVFDSETVQSKALGSVMAEANNISAVSVKLDLYPLPGISAGEIFILANDRPLKTLALGSEIKPSYLIPLGELGRDRLSRLSSIEAVIRVTDSKGRAHEASSDLCQIKTTPRELMPELAHPPHGTVNLEPDTITVEEITIVESSPLLNYVYFDAGQSEIPGRYALFKNPTEAQAFDEKQLKGTGAKYPHVLNIIGKRSAQRPAARLKIVGCNSGFGEEKGKTELSRSRAEAVRSYLRGVWGIDPARMEVEARALPAVASTSGIPEGRAENQRVEIYATDAAILDTVQSTYIEAVSDTDKFRITPQVEEGLDLKRWSIEIYGDDKRLEAVGGEGAFEPSYVLALKDIGLLNVGTFQSITAAIEGVDPRGQAFRAQDTSTVRFVKREERLSRREGYKVIEKYALILFDFDRADIKDRNQVVMDRINARIRELPAATVKIAGHTDTIGKPDYNIALSKKRAEAAYNLVLNGGTSARERISFEGRGPADPLFDNGLPEGRAFNRTVTVILEYERRE